MIRIIKVKKENTQAKLLDQEIMINLLGNPQNDTCPEENEAQFQSIGVSYMRSKHSLIQKYLLSIYYMNIITLPGRGSKNIKVPTLTSL